jgi:D-serine deaminase-like pyridoxal phosphate-dependent protein
VTISSLRTPAVLIDRKKALRNIEKMQAAASATGLRLRPHTKTHKSPLIAQWQIDRGAVGICCAKLGEAEVFADAGFKDIRLPYPINPSTPIA